MNTYVQDSTIPIYIILNYDKIYTLKFPINPENLTKEIPSNSEKADVEGIGEVSIPTTPRLAKLMISSFFWQDVNLVPSSMYVSWLEKWQKSKKPANLIVTRFNYSMQVTCESFRWWINAGEEQDIYFELRLQEYRSYGAKKLNVISNATLLEKITTALGEAVSPVLIEIPRPSRNSTNKERVTNPYTVKSNETIANITKKITGTTDEWELLYNENTKVIGEMYADEKNEIPSGTVLTLPAKWIDNSAYNIVNLGTSEL